MLDNRLFLRHLEDEEHIDSIVHKHWLSGIKHLALPILALFTLISILSVVPERVVATTVLILLIVTVLWLLRNFFDYYLDAWIITNTGIIDVEWHGWFHRESTRVLYSDIQGVSYEIKGLWPTLLRTGTVTVEKVSTGSAISMPYVKKPRRVEGLILKKMEEYLHQNNLRDAGTIQNLLVDVIAKEVQKQQFPTK
jgi:hypothetical protein